MLSWKASLRDAKFVMPGRVPGIHVFASAKENMDGRA
jgi:hypothetical protein